MRTTMTLIAAAVLASAAMPASATVTYTLESPGGPSFIWDAPDFVTGTTIVPFAVLTACTTRIGTCRSQGFYSDARAFGPNTDIADVVLFGSSGGAFAFYFPNGAFRRPGVYFDFIFNRTTSLTVTSTGAVPEPATWALLLAGFGAAGASLRRRRVVTVTA